MPSLCVMPHIPDLKCVTISLAFPGLRLGPLFVFLCAVHRKESQGTARRLQRSKAGSSKAWSLGQYLAARPMA